MGETRRNRVTRRSAATVCAVGALALAATPSVAFSFPNSSLWRERHLGHHLLQQPDQQPDYYGILGVTRNAGQDDIKKAFRQLVKQYHPDANPNSDTTTQFQTINKAYQILSEPQSRQQYNSQTYSQGLAADTPNFIIDALESDYVAPHTRNTANTDAVRYQPMELQPNANGRGSLFPMDDDEDQSNPYRIRSY